MIHAHAISSVLGKRQVIAFKFAFTHAWSFVTSVLVGVLLSLYVSGAIGKVFCRAPTVGTIRMVSMSLVFAASVVVAAVVGTVVVDCRYRCGGGCGYCCSWTVLFRRLWRLWLWRLWLFRLVSLASFVDKAFSCNNIIDNY
jgi:hypothetical protein